MNRWFTAVWSRRCCACHRWRMRHIDSHWKCQLVSHHLLAQEKKKQPPNQMHIESVEIIKPNYQFTHVCWAIMELFVFRALCNLFRFHLCAYIFCYLSLLVCVVCVAAIVHRNNSIKIPSRNTIIIEIIIIVFYAIMKRTKYSFVSISPWISMALVEIRFMRVNICFVSPACSVQTHFHRPGSASALSMSTRSMIYHCAIYLCDQMVFRGRMLYGMRSVDPTCS